MYVRLLHATGKLEFCFWCVHKLSCLFLGEMWCWYCVCLWVCLSVEVFLVSVQSGEVQVFDVINLVRDTILELPDSITTIWYRIVFIVLNHCSPLSFPHQKAVAAITAHDTPLAALTFNVTGTKLATASTTVRLECVCVCVFVGCCLATKSLKLDYMKWNGQRW